MGTSFRNDLSYSAETRKILKGIYKGLSFEGRFVFVDKGTKFKSLGSENIQKQFCVDTICQANETESVLVEEKFRRTEYPDLLVETMSCSVPGREKHGWIHSSQADYLFYVVDCKTQFKLYIISMQKLKKFYLDNQDKYHKKQTQQINRTEFILIPLAELKNKVGYKLVVLNK